MADDDRFAVRDGSGAILAEPKVDQGMQEHDCQNGGGDPLNTNDVLCFQGRRHSILMGLNRLQASRERAEETIAFKYEGANYAK